MKKTAGILLSIIVMTLLLTGCGSSHSQEPAKKVSLAPEITLNTVSSDAFRGKTVSQLTGELIDKKVADNRILAIMINNIDVAMPQTGIADADIMYECVVEGGITRLMGIYQNYKKISKMGPIRSARHYYVDFANEYKPVYAHFGQTSYAIDEIEKLHMDEISALYGPCMNAFYRDETRVAPHNAYTDGKLIKKAIKEGKFKSMNQLKKPHFDFNTEIVPVSGDGAITADTVDLHFNDYSHPWFKYNKKDGLYYRWQYKVKHMDEGAGKQIAYENIFVQFAKYSDRDSHGYQDIALLGKGDGYYISGGSAVPVTWKKKNKKSRTVFYMADGSEVKVNPGKTWISVFPSDNKDGVTIK